MGVWPQPNPLLKASRPWASAASHSVLFRGSSLPGMGTHTLLVQWAPGTTWPVSCRARCMGETLETPPSHSDNLPYGSPTSSGRPSSEARQALLPACPGMGWERGSRILPTLPSAHLAPAKAGYLLGQTACPPPSVPGSCQIRKSCPGLKKETFINNLNNNTADLNGHTWEAYRMVKKGSGAWLQS